MQFTVCGIKPILIFPALVVMLPFDNGILLRRVSSLRRPAYTRGSSQIADRIIAVGGLRSQLHPSSDIDLLIFLSRKSPDEDQA